MASHACVQTASNLKDPIAKRIATRPSSCAERPTSASPSFGNATAKTIVATTRMSQVCVLPSRQQLLATCPQFHCSPGEMQCSTKNSTADISHCITQEQICDGRKDCPEGDDEKKELCGESLNFQV